MEENNQQRTYCIYIHINKENNKVYVGQTGIEPNKRWKNGLGYKGCTYFYHAIQKYGWDGFYHVILFNHLTQEEANFLESIIIKESKSTIPLYGYNLMTGGGNSQHSEETKKKMREHHWDESGEKGPMYGRRGSLSPVYGKKFNHKGKIQYKSIKCIETGEVFKGAKEIEELLKLDHSSIIKCCKEKMKTSGGLHWEYTTEESNNEGKISTIELLASRENKPPINSRPVRCVETGIQYYSAREAERKTGIFATSITQCCKGKQKKTKGLHWEYVEKELDNQDDV